MLVALLSGADAAALWIGDCGVGLRRVGEDGMQADGDPTEGVVPRGASEASATGVSELVRVARELAGVEVEPGDEVVTIRHGVTRYSITLVCVEAELRRGKFASDFYAEAKWVKPSEAAEYPMSTSQRKLAER